MLGKKNIKKRSGKATGHNDHYMINMGGQRQKIGGNCPLTNPYLQGRGGIYSFFQLVSQLVMSVDWVLYTTTKVTRLS